MANDIWSATDIANKVQAIIRSKVSATDELKAARLYRKESMSDSERAFISACDAAVVDSLAEGKAATEDMVLLLQVLELEKASARLALPVIEEELNEVGLVTNQEAIDADLLERTNAQAVVDAGSVEAKALFDLRNPYAEPEPELEPVLDENVSDLLVADS
jgi:hypothetical protein